MNSNRTSKLLRVLGLAGAAAVAGSGILAYAAGKNSSADTSSASAVTVKVDTTPIQRLPGSEISFAPIVQRVTPSVVKVVTRESARDVESPGAGMPFEELMPWFFGPNTPDRQNRRPARQPAREGLGSGVIVSAEGYVLTNNHVVEGADKLTVQLADGREFSAKVIGADPNTDLAVIKVEATDLPAITFADSDEVMVGDRVLAVGNPFNFGQTVTSGIVSGKSRSSSALGLQYQDFIQTDAAINPGNSGGALVDMHGRLIGINTAIYSRSGGFQGIGFAIPSHLARQVMDSLVQYGKVTRGYLGVLPQEITPTLAQEFKLKNTTGVLIASVDPETPAEKAGLQMGDVVVKFADIEVKNVSQFRLAVAGVAPGREVPVTIIRDGRERVIDVTMVARPQDPNVASVPEAAPKDTGVLNGVAVTDITPQVRREFEIPERVSGAIVSQVDPESPAAEAGLTPGDVILDIAGESVKSADDVVRLTATSDDYRTRLRIWSRGATQYIVVDESAKRPE